MQNAQRSAMASGMGRMQGEMQRQSNELQEIAREQQEILAKTEGVNNSALTERDSALKNKLDRFLEKAVSELGQLTELFPDREGPDDPSLLTNLDDATMNSLLKNLIAKLLNKDFPGYGEGDGCARKELAKNARRHRSRRAQRAEKSLDDIKSELEALLNEPAQALNDAEKRDVRDLAHRQDVLQRTHRRAARKTGIAVSALPSARSEDRAGHRRSRAIHGQRAKSARPVGFARRGAAGASRPGPAVAIAATDAICRCSKWRSAASSATCRSPGCSARGAFCPMAR